MPDDLRERIVLRIKARADCYEDDYEHRENIHHWSPESAFQAGFREAARIASETPLEVFPPAPCLGTGCGKPTERRFANLPSCCEAHDLDIDRRLRPESYHA